MKYHLIIKGADTDVKGICEAHKEIEKYAYILHDNEFLAFPHYHVFLECCNSPVREHDIRLWFNRLCGIQKIAVSIQVELNYMLHSRDVLYHPYDIVANFDIMPYLNGSEE